VTSPSKSGLERENLREQTRRDIERLQRRQPESRFWRWVALIGSVGWPIALLGAGGAVLGRYLDARWGSGVRFTLMLLVMGISLGTFIAFRALREDDSE
jgi:ATP synthase protein I